MTTPSRAAALVVAAQLGLRDGGPPAYPGPAVPATRKRAEILAFIAARAACPDLTPGRIARQTGVSRTVLYRMLESLGGVAAVVQQHRLRAMSAALADWGDARSIQAIAHHSGFRSPSHANRVFRKTFGMTPSAFRRAGLAGPVSPADRSGP